MQKILFFLLIFLSFNIKAEAKEMILYSHLTDDIWQIWVMDSDGQNKRQITNSREDKRGPTWIHHQKKIAFRTSNSHLYTVDLDGKNEEEVLSKYGVVTNPNFSKVNHELVFIRFDPRGKDIADIWKSDLKGENSTLLTKDKMGKFQPRFSPRGDKIAFVKRDSNLKDYHLWLMNADGSNPIQLTNVPGFDTHPDFSPDQNTIVFCSNRKGNYEIYRLDLRDMSLKQLTDHHSLDTQPRFSADGQKIVFVSGRTGSQQVWVMDSDDFNASALTSEASESIDPEWGEI